MKKFLIFLAVFLVTPFLLLGAASAAANGTYSTNKVVSTSAVKDLVVTHVTVPVKGVKGCNIIVSNTIKNQGNGTAGGFRVNYYLKKSLNSVSSYIGQRYIKSLGSGASNNQNTYLSIPTNITKGNYYLLTYADAGKNVLESNETNNYHFSSTHIQIIGPDYILFNNKIGADVTKNSAINKNIPKTDFAKTIFRLEKNGSVMLKFGNGIGPKVLISAGIHGNEPQANIAIMKYLELIKADQYIKGTLYVIPFALPIDTSLNTRYYNGKDPNRIANVLGTPSWKIVQFAKNNRINYLLDVHSGGGVSKNGFIYVNHQSTNIEKKWVSYIISKTLSSTGFDSADSAGMIRVASHTYGVNSITLETERDSAPVLTAANTEYKMIIAACKYLGLPSN
jgi:uncharacterized protein